MLPTSAVTWRPAAPPVCTPACALTAHLDIDVANYIQFLRESSTLDVDGQTWDMEDRNLKMTPSCFRRSPDGHHHLPRFGPCMATVRPALKKNALRPGQGRRRGDREARFRA